MDPYTFMMMGGMGHPGMCFPGHPGMGGMMMMQQGPAVVIPTAFGPMLVQQQPQQPVAVMTNHGLMILDGGGQRQIMGMSQQRHRPREERLAHGQTATLYHETADAGAVAIESSQRFRRGDDSGSAGSGIYFATSPGDCHRKAHNHGVVLQATVRLGNVKTVDHPESFTFTELDNSGYDSVKLTCYTGDEYVVYNYDQVTNIRRCG